MKNYPANIKLAGGLALTLFFTTAQEAAPSGSVKAEGRSGIMADQKTNSSERNWKTAWRNLGEIKTALESDVKAQKSETQARLKELIGDDKYSGVFKNYIETSVAKGSPSYDKDHQFMITQLRDGKEVSFQAAAPKAAEVKPAALSRDEMRDLLPPDPKKFVASLEGEVQYQDMLFNKAEQALNFITSKEASSAQVRQLLAKYKEVDGNYGSTLESARKEFLKAENDPVALREVYLSALDSIRSDRFDASLYEVEDPSPPVKSNMAKSTPSAEPAWQEKIALRPEVMAGFLIPDRKLFPLTGKGEMDYEERLRSNAAGAVLFMSSGQMYPKDAEKVIEVHKYAKSGYGEILEKAWNEFKDTKRETPGDPSKYIRKIDEVMYGHNEDIDAGPRSETPGDGRPVAAKDKLTETSIKTAFDPLRDVFKQAHDHSYEPAVAPKVDNDRTLVAAVTTDMPKNG